MSLFGTGRRERCLAVLLLAVLCAVVHAPGLFFGRARLPIDVTQLPPESRTARAPVDPTWREAQTNQCIVAPALRAAGQVLQDGEWPLWNRNARFGEPFVASGVTLLYPPWWLLVLHPGAASLELLLFLHTVLALSLIHI